jgi:hypothetical protein
MKLLIGLGVLLVCVAVWIRARWSESHSDDPTRHAALLDKLGSIPTDRFR